MIIIIIIIIVIITGGSCAPDSLKELSQHVLGSLLLLLGEALSSEGDLVPAQLPGALSTEVPHYLQQRQHLLIFSQLQLQ